MRAPSASVVGGEERVAGPGETVSKPRGVPHAFWNGAVGARYDLDLRPETMPQLIARPGLVDPVAAP